MNKPRTESGDIALLAFLDQLKNDLSGVREDRSAIKLTLRRACEHFKVDDGCVAVSARDCSRVELISVIPRGGQWDLSCLDEFIRQARPRIASNIVMAPVYRRGRLWAVLALRGQQAFEIPSSYVALRRIARVLSECIELIDWKRNIEVRSRIDRKMLEQLGPQDLFYQILHGLRSLLQYDHSSAILICNPRENTLELVAEQIAWHKGKSHLIGRKLPLDDQMRALIQKNAVYGYNRRDSGWHEWSGRQTSRLAELLDYNNTPTRATSDRRESCMLCAPLATREGVLGVLKVAACHHDFFNEYEGDLVQRFTPLAAIAIQNSQRAVTLETKMLEAEKKHAVANLLRGVSHDVNNALGSVLPLVQQILIECQARTLGEETLAEDLQQIEQSIQTCRRIFGGMLALARGASQGITQANVRRALDSTLAILRDGLARQGVQLDVQIGDFMPNIQAGQGDIEQLFLNLATNARDAMPSGGVLSIRTEVAGDHIAILVQDTGCGIPAEVMSRIQEPFFTTKKNGNGLGLSICRSIIWNARGQMEITSEPGTGTQDHSPVAHRARSCDGQRRMSSWRILVVDDEAGILRSVERVLGQHYEVAGTRSPREAVRLAATFKPALAVLDIQMPEMDGFQLMEELQALDPELDVIFMTGSIHELDATLIRAIRKNAFYFLQKPFDRGVLVSLVDRCLERKQLDYTNRQHLRRVERELGDARAFQQAMLPPRSATVGGISVCAQYIPCTELAGDFYDYVAVPSGGAAILVADVSGHGASAAMLTGVVKAAFRSAASDMYEPLCVAERVANAMSAFGADRFISLICARLRDASLEYVNAGHPSGILTRPGGPAILLESTGPIISPALLFSAEQRTIEVSRGSDRLVLFTDAILEAESESGEYGLDRLVEEVSASSMDGDALLNRVLQSVKQFAADSPINDDLTLLIADL